MLDIVAMQLFVHDMAHPAGLMTDLCSTFYNEEVCVKIASVVGFYSTGWATTLFPNLLTCS